MKHLLKLLDCKQEEITAILDLADQLKYERKHNITHRLLEGKSIGLIFQKSSTRTRVSFETGIFQLGGQALFLSSRDQLAGEDENVIVMDGDRSGMVCSSKLTQAGTPFISFRNS